MALPNKPITRKEQYLAKAAGQATSVPEYPITREEAYLDKIAKGGGGSGGTSNYNDLDNKPSINNVTLSGNKTTSDLGLVGTDDMESGDVVQSNGTLPSLSIDNEGYIHFDAGTLATLKTVNVITRPYVIPAWSTGTDAEIVEALQKHYAGDIDLTQEWQIGDERIIHLSAMEAMSPLPDTHAAQDVIYVLSEIGGKTLATPINQITECAFQVDQVNLLAGTGLMNTRYSNQGGWKELERRTWCNTIYKNSLPQTIQSIFKEFINLSGLGGGSTTGVEQTIDTFALRAEIEVFGSTTYSVEGEGSQITYYETNYNRVKDIYGQHYGNYWWLRSPRGDNNNMGYCIVNSSGDAYRMSASNPYGIAPFGVI